MEISQLARQQQQTGNPSKLARAIMIIAGQSLPPRRFIPGADAIGGAEQKVVALKEDIESNRPLSTSLDFDHDTRHEAPLAKSP